MLGVVAVLYQTHAGALAKVQDHLLPYYYGTAGHESIFAFLVRNWKNLLNLFVPFQIPGDTTAMVILVLAVIGGLALFRGFLRARDANALRAASTASA